MTQPYDSSWDRSKDADVFVQKCDEWEKRDWCTWLKENLSFPFEVKRMEDMVENPYDPDDGPFSVGRRMQVTDLGEEDFPLGFLVCVESKKAKGSIPLADVQVADKRDSNFWPVREYVVWMANH